MCSQEEQPTATPPAPAPYMKPVVLVLNRKTLSELLTKMLRITVIHILLLKLYQIVWICRTLMQPQGIKRCMPLNNKNVLPTPGDETVDEPPMRSAASMLFIRT